MGYPRGVLHVPKGTAFELSPYPLLCTRVYTVVYPRVHCCIHACTQRRSLLLRLGTLFYSTNGLSSARQKGSCQLHGWLFSVPSLRPYKLMYPRAGVAGICAVIWIYGRKCTTFADANPSEGVQSRRDERGGREEERVRAFARKFAVKFGSSEKSSTFATAKRKKGGRK